MLNGSKMWITNGPIASEASGLEGRSGWLHSPAFMHLQGRVLRWLCSGCQHCHRLQFTPNACCKLWPVLQAP